MANLQSSRRFRIQKSKVKSVPRTKLTNELALARRVRLGLLWGFSAPFYLALATHNLRRLLQTFEALADLGPALTGESDFQANALAMLRAALDAVGAREGVLFTFNEKPALLRSAAVHGLA